MLEHYKSFLRHQLYKPFCKSTEKTSILSTRFSSSHSADDAIGSISALARSYSAAP